MTLNATLIRSLLLAGLAWQPAGMASAQEEVAVDYVRDYVNRRVVVQAMVADVRHQKNGEVWLSLGKAYPKGPLVVVIPPEMLGGHPDYSNYRGRMVRVTGMVRPSFMEGEPYPATGRRAPVIDGPTRPSIVLDNPQRLEMVPLPPGP